MSQKNSINNFLRQKLIKRSNPAALKWDSRSCFDAMPGHQGNDCGTLGHAGIDARFTCKFEDDSKHGRDAPCKIRTTGTWHCEACRTNSDLGRTFKKSYHGQNNDNLSPADGQPSHRSRVDLRLKKKLTLNRRAGIPAEPAISGLCHFSGFKPIKTPKVIVDLRFCN